MATDTRREPAAQDSTPRTRGYLLLMRHGQREHAPARPEREHSLTTRGLERTSEVAAALREIAGGEGGTDRVRVGVVVHGSHVVTAATANALVGRCGTEAGWEEEKRLDPGWFYDNEACGDAKARHDELVASLCGRVRALGEKADAVLVVGHQPQLGWIAETLTGQAEAVAGSEILAIRIDHLPESALPSRDQCRVCWVLTPSEVDAEVLPELKKKIESKMKVAELLGVVIVGVLSWLLTSPFDEKAQIPLGRSPWAALAYGLALAAFAVALALYAMTIFAYDELMMPDRFWSTGRRRGRPRPRTAGLSRPPTSAARLLHRNMVNAWSRLFVPATWAVGVGLALLALAVAATQWSRGYPPSTLGWVVTPVAVAAAAGICAWSWGRGRPRLGTQD